MRPDSSRRQQALASLPVRSSTPGKTSRPEKFSVLLACEANRLLEHINVTV
ncbi:MAG: hypothetical protein MUF54_19495 [Polyangiaceae bacterium]|nr:hypothetical protein [Polyangiaceae bacterium]